MKPLLIVLNPRRIPECVEAISALRIDKVWLQNYTETDISYVYPRVVEESNHDLIGVLSDDTIPTQDALDAVLAISDLSVVSTGWCPLDDESDLVNLSTEPLATSVPSSAAYSFPTRAWVEAHPTPIVPTSFAGHCLTFMDRDLCRRFPWQVHGGPPGYASDLMLSWRLQEAGVPIIAARDGGIRHVKARWNYIDDTPGRELLVGREPGRVVWDPQEDTP